MMSRGEKNDPEQSLPKVIEGYGDFLGLIFGNLIFQELKRV